MRAVVRAIPRGKVLPYSRVAILAGIPGGARRVSRALHASDGLPWWRVVRADHTLAKEVSEAQAKKLRHEGVKVMGRKLPRSSRATMLEVEEALERGG